MLKAAWARYGTVRISEVDEHEFESERDRDQILDMFPWSVHDHCLNLKICKANMCIEEIVFDTVQM